MDPYRNFNFRVKLEGRVVAGASEVSGLEQATEAPRAGEAVATSRRKALGPTGLEAVTLKRAVTFDAAFEQLIGAWVGDWANILGAHRKDLVIELCNEAGRAAMTYELADAWVSKCEGIVRLERPSPRLAIESLTLQYRGYRVLRAD